MRSWSSAGSPGGWFGSTRMLQLYCDYVLHTVSHVFAKGLSVTYGPSAAAFLHLHRLTLAGRPAASHVHTVGMRECGANVDRPSCSAIDGCAFVTRVR